MIKSIKFLCGRSHPMRKYKLCASVSILMCCLWSIGIFAQGDASGPAKEFRIVGKRPSPLPGIESNRAYPLLNSRGEIIGSYKGVEAQDGKKYLGTLQNGASFLIDPLTYLIVSKDGSSVITYGDGVDFHEVANVKAKLYSSSGDLIKSLVTDIWAPFAFAVQDNGDFWIAGRKGYNGGASVIARYTSSGDLSGEIRLTSNYAPMRLIFSPDNTSAVLILYNHREGGRLFHYFDANGALKHVQELSDGSYGAEFLSNDKVLVYSGRQWKLYDMNESLTLVSSGQLKGNPLGEYPVTRLPDGSSFTIVTLGNREAGTGYRVQAVRADNGQVFAESVLEGAPHWQPYRFLQVSSAGTVELFADDEIVELQINN